MSTLIIYEENSQQLETLKAVMKALKIKFKIAKSEPYNPDFVAKIKESDQQYKNGKFARVKISELDTFLGIE